MTELMFYRCMLCSHVVSVWDVKKGGCQNCNGTRIRPTNLNLFEKLVQVIKHPLIWEWKKHDIVPAQLEGQDDLPADVGSDTDAVQGSRVSD